MELLCKREKESRKNELCVFLRKSGDLASTSEINIEELKMDDDRIGSIEKSAKEKFDKATDRGITKDECFSRGGYAIISTLFPETLSQKTRKFFTEQV